MSVWLFDEVGMRTCLRTLLFVGESNSSNGLFVGESNSSNRVQACRMHGMSIGVED